MSSNPHFSRRYALSILTGIVLCANALNSGCSYYSRKQSDHPNTAERPPAALTKDHDHPNTAEGTQAAVKELLAVVEKSFADLPPPPSVPAVCADEMTKLREILKTAPGTAGAANASSALLRCTSKATNETNCKGKPQPCGVVYYNPPIKPPPTVQSESIEPKAVDVSMPDQIAAACTDIAGAVGGGLSAAVGAPQSTDVMLGSMVGNYNCGAWFKAAAKNDPTLLIGLGFVPTIQLLRDLKTYTNGVVDVTPEAVLANTVRRVDFTLVTVPMGGTFVPIGVLPSVPVGGTPGQVLDGAHKTAQQRVKQVGKSIGEACKAAGICQ